MLEKLDKKNSSKIQESVEKNDTNRIQLEIRKNNLIKEQYSKQTLLGLLERLNSEIIGIQKDINSLDSENLKLQKFYEKERINDNLIKEKCNQLFNKAKKFEKVKY